MADEPGALSIFRPAKPRALWQAVFQFAEVTYHTAVNSLRKQSGTAALGVLVPIIQSMVMVLIFFAMYSLLGMRSAAIRGDFVLFLLTGIFLFLLHNKAITAVSGSATSISGIMQLGPMSPLLMICANLLATLFTMVAAAGIILFFVHVLRGGLELVDPLRLIAAVMLAFFSGAALGFVFLTLKPLAPRLVGMISMAYRRLNMITSGKFLPASYMPAGLLPWFDWNPLFHSVDQARGATFVNYEATVTTLIYPLIFGFLVLVVGLMGEHWLSRFLSSSWTKR